MPSREAVDLYLGQPGLEEPVLWVDLEPSCVCGHKQGAHAGDGLPMRTTACHHMDWVLNVRCPCTRYQERCGEDA